MGTSIHKDIEAKSASPMKFFGGMNKPGLMNRASASPAPGVPPGAPPLGGGSIADREMRDRAKSPDSGDGGLFGKGGIGRQLLNPMGAILEKTGLADTGIGKVLNPLSLLKGKI